MRLTAALATFAALALATPQARAAVSSAPYRTVSLSKAFPNLQLFRNKIAADGQGQFALVYYWTLDGAPAASVPAWIDYRTRRDPLPVAADGRVEHLPTPAEIAARPSIGLAAQPRARFDVRMELQSTLRPAISMDAAAVARSIAGAAGAIRRAAGPLGRIVPKIKKAIFMGAGAGQVAFADGRAQPLPSEEDGPVYEPDRMPGAVRLHFAHVPSRVRLVD